MIKYTDPLYSHKLIKGSTSEHKESTTRLLKEYFTDNPHKINDPDENDQTPLSLALSSNNLTLVRVLLKCPGIDINKETRGGWNPLLIACKKSYIDAVVTILQYSETDVNARNKKGWSALALACSQSNVDMVLELLKYPDVDLNSQTNKGWTPLMIVFNKIKQLNMRRIASLLLERGDINIHLKNKNKETALAVLSDSYIGAKLYTVNDDLLEAIITIMLTKSNYNINNKPILGLTTQQSLGLVIMCLKVQK